jgi:aspartate/methionine/tyrosine aminotransferase
LNNINLNDDIDIWYKLYLDIDKQILKGFHIPLNVLEEDIKFAAELLNNTIPNNPVEQTIQNNKVEQILRLGDKLTK